MIWQLSKLSPHHFCRTKYLQKIPENNFASININSMDDICMCIDKPKCRVNSTYKPIDIRWKRTFSSQTLPWTSWLKLALTKQEAGRVSVEARTWLLFFPDRDPSKSSKIAAWGNGNATKFGEFVNFNWLVLTVNPPINWKKDCDAVTPKNMITNGNWTHGDIFSIPNCIFIQFYNPLNLFKKKKILGVDYMPGSVLCTGERGKQEQ